MNRLPAALAAVLLILILASCATMSESSGRAAEPPRLEQDLFDSAAAPSAAASRSGLGGGAAAELAVSPGAQPAARPEDPVPEEPGPDDRLRVYSAELELLVARVEESREQVITAAEEAGGYVESSGGEFITIRVPAERFDAVLADLERLGRIRSRAVRTADVTEQYADLGRRIDLAERTRERFYALLERTTDTEERVEILREIRRLTERIERLRGQLDSLDRQIAYSRITVRLTARIDTGGPARSSIPFPWIARLDPLERTTRAPRSRPDVPLPPDYAVFDTGRFVSAETAEGTRVRLGAVMNDPRGDTPFWQEALRASLGDLYTVVRELEAGELSGALFEAKTAQPFSYAVLVRADDDEILVAEAFFPDTEVRQERLAEILDAFREVGS